MAKHYLFCCTFGQLSVMVDLVSHILEYATIVSHGQVNSHVCRGLVHVGLTPAETNRASRCAPVTFVCASSSLSYKAQ